MQLCLPLQVAAVVAVIVAVVAPVAVAVTVAVPWLALVLECVSCSIDTPRAPLTQVSSSTCHDGQAGGNIVLRLSEEVVHNSRLDVEGEGLLPKGPLRQAAQVYGGPLLSAW